MKNQFIKVASNKKYIYFIYKFEMTNINNIFPFQKEIHCVYDKSKKILNGYYSHVDNKLHNVLNLMNISIENFKLEIEKSKPNFEKKILLIMTTLVLSNSVISADMIKSFESHRNINYIESQLTLNNENSSPAIINIAGGTQLTNNKQVISQISNGIYEGINIVEDYKKNNLNDNTKYDKQIVLTLDKNYETIKEISKNLQLNPIEENNLKSGEDSLISAFAFETNKEGIYLSLNNRLLDKYKNNPQELKEISKLFKTISIHEGMHNIKGEKDGFKLGGEAFSVYSQLQGEKLNFNSNSINDLVNFAKINEINSMVDIQKSQILKLNPNNSEEIKKIQDIIKNSMYDRINKYVSTEELDLNEKKSLLNYLSNERSKLGTNYVNYNEYLQTIHPNDIEYGIEGGYIHNFAKILIDSGQSPVQAFQNLEKLNKDERFGQYIAEKFVNNVLSQKTLPSELEEKFKEFKKNKDYLGFIKSLDENFYHNMMKNISLAMYDSCVIYDKDNKLKEYYESKIKEDNHFKYFSKWGTPDLKKEYELKNKLLEMFDPNYINQNKKLESESIFNLFI